MERFTRQPSNQNQQQSAQQGSGGSPRPAASGGGSGGAVAQASKAFNSPSVSSKLLVVSLIVASIAVTVALAFSVVKGFSASSLVKEDQYQAVFLDNGQVYFGKLSNINSEYARLTDIYYLQVDQQIQPEQQEEGDQQQQQPQISLAKLGNELHGPEDEMFILQDKIVFWENLKDDGQVVQAITQFKQGGGQQNNQQQQQPVNGGEEQ